ncbi:MAG: hypothetical protein LBQ70_02525 [Prevotellaceae bacterium]|jgi:prepilin-type processing-associated H-X9-DG protein|nr:hypothetical protein [Prevotellaceae bacterium]
MNANKTGLTNFISYCSIDKNGVVVDDKKVFEGTDTDVLTYFDNILKHFEIDCPKFAKMDAMTKLGFLTAEILLNNIPEHVENLSPYECGILLSNSSSSLNTDFNYWDTFKRIPSPSTFVYTLPNVVNAEICIRHGFKGENMFFTADSFASSGVVEYANALFADGSLKFCLCGWVELLKDEYNAVIFAAKTGFVRE